MCITTTSVPPNQARQRSEPPPLRQQASVAAPALAPAAASLATGLCRPGATPRFVARHCNTARAAQAQCEGGRQRHQYTARDTGSALLCSQLSHTYIHTHPGRTHPSSINGCSESSRAPKTGSGRRGDRSPAERRPPPPPPGLVPPPPAALAPPAAAAAAGSIASILGILLYTSARSAVAPRATSTSAGALRCAP